MPIGRIGVSPNLMPGLSAESLSVQFDVKLNENRRVLAGG